MEEIRNLITGRFVETETETKGFNPDEDSDDDDDDGEAFSFKDVSSMGGGKHMANYVRPKVKTGNLIELGTGKLQRVRGALHLPDPWWQVTILRTKTTKERLKEPKDQHALCYRFRDDASTRTDKLVHMFISKIGHNLGEGQIQDSFHQLRTQFETYLRSRALYDDLELLNLEERLTDYVDSLPEEERERPEWFKTLIITGEDYSHVQLSQVHPEILHYCSQLFPFHFNTIIAIPPDDLAGIAQAIEEEPGNLAFKAIVSRLYGISNCETSEEALTRSGLMAKVPQYVRDAIKIYEYMKRESRDAGHTYIHFNKILDVLGPVVQQMEEALEFLNKYKVTKTQLDGGYRVVYLMHLWQAESKIAKGLNSLLQREEDQPWQLEVDFDREDFESIRQDADQLRTAKLITTQPVVAISGKGGCGKTYVVTKVMMAAKAKRSAHGALDMDTQPPEDYHDADTQQPGSDDDMFPDDEPAQVADWEDDEEEEKKCPDEVKLLLTAPTGKAANLLGKRAGMPSFTLHQVIWSHPPMNGAEWKHKDINILVVDECSLVSVTTFSRLLDILLRSSRLRHIVLLGDIRQLPSIEPGNFLSDTFQSLDRIGCAVELRTNHRAESQLIVDNATAISKRTFPLFDDKQFILRRLPEGNPAQTGNDYLCQDINEDVTKLLLHDRLKSDVTSQFISFTRRVCESINDLCCKKYSNHRIKDQNGRYDFRTGDKICCTKNGYIDLYTEEHGLMTCDKKKKTDSKRLSDQQESQGGMDRFEEPGQDGGENADETVDKAKDKDKKTNDTEKLRLCNGEIFFILNEVERQDNHGNMKTFLQLSDKDAEEELMFWADKRQMKKKCKIRHAWARTIHTFQGSETDHVIYIVGSKSRRQNWQHVYTAITRGRKTVFIVSAESTLREAIKRSEIKRQTGLRKQLVEKFQKNPNFNATVVGQKSFLNHTLMATQPGPSNTTMLTSLQKHKPTPTVNLGGDEKTATKGIMEYFIKGKNSRQTAGANLNTTQQITDVLTSLAAEHDSDDIEEYNSDGSDSLLTRLKPKPTVAAGDDIEHYSSDNSDGSDSILATGTSQKHTGSGRPARLKERSSVTAVKLKDRQTEECVKNVDLKDNTSDEEMSPSLLSTQADTVNVSHITTRNRKPGRLSRLSKKKSGDHKVVHSEKQAKSHLGLGNQGVSPVVIATRGAGNEQKHQHLQHQLQTPASRAGPSTSSPCIGAHVTIPHNWHIRPGNSPATPGFELPGYPKVTSPASAIKKDSPVHQDSENVDEICDPKSNESQWSDINDSDYLRMDDTSLIQMAQQNNTRPGLNSAPGALPFTMLKQSVLSKTPNLPSKDPRLSFQTPEQRDVSTNSLWSEADEDQYVTLDLTDIQNMVQPDYHSDADTTSHREQDQASPTDRPGRHRDSYSLRRSPQIDIPDTPPSPPSRDMFESPPRSRSLQQSPGVKRITAMDDNDLVVKSRRATEAPNVSPLKRSLAKLEFE